jgi:hypothetical protein
MFFLNPAVEQKTVGKVYKHARPKMTTIKKI